MIQKLKTFARDRLPRYISLGLSDHPRTVARAEQPHYAGNAHRPFEPSAEFLNTLRGPRLAALRDRRALLATFDAMRRDLDFRGETEAMDSFTTRALEMLSTMDSL